jgi:hypothetical protein
MVGQHQDILGKLVLRMGGGWKWLKTISTGGHAYKQRLKLAFCYHGVSYYL